MALVAASSYKNVCMLGDIVHNEDVVRQMAEAGIKKIKRLGAGNRKMLLLRAHGATKETIRKIKRRGYELIDATCPMVKEIHTIALDMEKKCRRIIIIGDKNHDEVQGIIGQLKTKAIVIDNLRDIPLKAVKKINKACVVAQSTQNIDEVLKIVEVLKKNISHLEFFNTICGPTRMKQREIRKMPRENDVMIIIGSKKSANTKRLYEISRSLNPRSYWINGKDEIKAGWVAKVKRVGVTAGASTPESTIREVVGYLKELSLSF